MNIKLHAFPNTETLHPAMLELFAEYLPRPGGLMLSGGNTPLDIYRQLPAGNIEATLFLGDERYVPDSDSASNYGTIFPIFNVGQASCLSGQAGLDQRKRGFAIAKQRPKEVATPSHFIKVQTELPLKDAAQAFHDELSRIEKIPLGFLGLGTDGHTASLFNMEDASLRDNRLAIPVIKKEKPDRISVTPTLLNRVERIIILAAGEEKKEMIQTLLNEPETIPAGVALSDHPNIEVWTEQNIR